MATKRATRKKTSSKQSTVVPVNLVDVTARDDEGRTPLHRAAFYGYVTIVRQLLQQDAEVDARDNQQRTPGHWSAFKGHLAVVEALVKSGADINARDEAGRTWLKMATIGEQNDVERYLRSHGGEL